MTFDMNAIYDGYFDRAVYIALPYVRNDIDKAKDIAQESMIKIWKKQDLFDETKAKFYTWFLRIVRNTAYDRYRADTLRVILREDKSGWEYFECPCINTDTIDLEMNLNKIDVKYRTILYLSFIEGHTQEKIAEILDVPLGTVKSRVKIGMRELRKIYV